MNKPIQLLFILLLAAMAVNAQGSLTPASIGSGSVQYIAARILLQCHEQESWDIASTAVDDLVAIGDSAVPVLLAGLRGSDAICTLLKDSASISQCGFAGPLRGVSHASCHGCAKAALKKLGRKALPSLVSAYFTYPDHAADISFIILRSISNADTSLLLDALRKRDFLERFPVVTKELIRLGVRIAPKRFAAIADSLLTTAWIKNCPVGFCTFIGIVHDFRNKERARKAMMEYVGQIYGRIPNSPQLHERTIIDTTPNSRYQFETGFCEIDTKVDTLAQTLFYIGKRGECVRLCSLAIDRSHFECNVVARTFALTEKYRLHELVPRLIAAMYRYESGRFAPDSSRAVGSPVPSLDPCVEKESCIAALVQITGKSFGLVLGRSNFIHKGYDNPPQWEFNGSKEDLEKSISLWNTWYVQKRDSLQRSSSKSPVEKPEPLYRYNILKEAVETDWEMRELLDTLKKRMGETKR